MTRGILGGVLAIVLAAMAHAAAAQPAATPSASAPPSERQLALARELVEATGISGMLTAELRDVVGQTYASMAPAASPQTEARRKVLEEAQADAMSRLAPKIVQSMVDGYARNFTAKELSDTLAFYESPTGKAMVVKMPQLMRGMTANMIRDLPEIRREMGEEACAKITCTAAERTAFFGAAAAKN
ncbi:MAG TPA: DUF2059 domain-containing protein [Caulobacteraceae bacterium]|jgi:hypothetical protein